MTSIRILDDLSNGLELAVWSCTSKLRKALKSQRNIVGMGGMAFFAANRRNGPTAFPIVHGFGPSDFPTISLQLFNNGFPVLPHLSC